MDGWMDGMIFFRSDDGYDARGSLSTCSTECGSSSRCSSYFVVVIVILVLGLDIAIVFFSCYSQPQQPHRPKTKNNERVDRWIQHS